MWKFLGLHPFVSFGTAYISYWISSPFQVAPSKADGADTTMDEASTMNEMHSDQGHAEIIPPTEKLQIMLKDYNTKAENEDDGLERYAAIAASTLAKLKDEEVDADMLKEFDDADWGRLDVKIAERKRLQNWVNTGLFAGPTNALSGVTDTDASPFQLSNLMKGFVEGGRNDPPQQRIVSGTIL